MSQAYAPNSLKLNNIQALRAFAALSVVIFHTNYTFPHMLPFGSFGVDVFFVISGYIMARILATQGESGGAFFFRRRVIRIVPPYWFFTILLFFAAFVAPRTMGSTRASGVDLAKSLLFLPFYKQPGLIQPLLFVGWSLNYEMFFYVMLTLGIMVHARLGGVPLVKKLDQVWIGGALVVVTMAVCGQFAAGGAFAAFYSRDIVLEFLLGILSYYCCRGVSNDSARRWRVAALAVSLISAAFMIAYQGLMNFPATRILPLGVPSFLLVSAASLLSQGGWDIELAWLVLIGDASYMLYLVHIFCELSIDRVLSPHAYWLKMSTLSGATVGVTLSVIIALALHVFGERPTLQYLNRRLGGARKSTEFSTPAV
jgi:peptidoglycan/LPS O-acetylase OafA/YrhL